jgi:hypothetical protein
MPSKNLTRLHKLVPLATTILTLSLAARVRIEHSCIENAPLTGFVAKPSVTSAVN